MCRVPALSELASRILSELEEAGSENFSSTVNTVLSPKGDSEEIQDSIDALEELLGRGLVVLARELSWEEPPLRLSGEESLEAMPALALCVSFDAEARLWKWDKAQPLIEIVATEVGRDAAFQILDERGYQWWRQTPES
jgi:hypothetical protein